MNPRISIVMIDGSFREKLHTIDFFGQQSIPSSDYELLWVEYYDRVNPGLQEKTSKYPNFQIITLGKEDLYHSSYCFNAGILASQGEIVVIPDADVVVEKNFLERVWEDHRANEKLVMYIYRYDEPKRAHVPNVQIEHLQQVCALTNPANYGGCLSVRRKWLLEINGYEQHPIFGSGFHANGLDVYTRLKNLGLHVKWHPELKLYHPWHPATLADARSYRAQRIVIDYRAVNLKTKPFQGIDAAHNSEMPDELAAEIEIAKRRYGAVIRKIGAKVRSLVR
jgi:hypothetical protein